MVMKKCIAALISGAVSLATVAAEKTQAADTGPVIPPTSVYDIMVGAIEPASNSIWAIALEENAPRNEDDWKAIEREIIQLLAATSATSLGSTLEKEREWAKDPRWTSYSKDMMEVTVMMLDAARARDYEGTMDASNLLVESCGGCHQAFPSSR